MPVNRNALIRYQTIDKCLSNRQRKWTLLDLIDACTKALEQYEKKKNPISRRTIQLDIQTLRSGQLGYHAPIIVVEKKYYTYEDPDFSISNLPLSENDLNRLSEVVNTLKQFKGFSHFNELDGMVKKLEDKIEVALHHRTAVIDFDRNEQLKGIDFLDPIYQSILEKEVLKVAYHPFWRPDPIAVVIHPYLLKQHQNRWYLIGFSEEKRKIILLALDRIVDVKKENRIDFIENNFFNPEIYFREVIGVTVDLKSKPTEVILYVLPNRAPFILTKPIHHSQKLIKKIGRGILISLQVRINYELREVIRSLGDGAIVLKPNKLRLEIERNIEKAQANYKDKNLRAKLWQILRKEQEKNSNTSSIS